MDNEIYKKLNYEKLLSSKESILAILYKNKCVYDGTDNSYMNYLLKTRVIDQHIYDLQNAFQCIESRFVYVRCLDEYLNPEKYTINNIPLRDNKLNNTELKQRQRDLCKISRQYLACILAGNEVNHAFHKYLSNTFLFEASQEVQRNPDGYLDLWARAHFKSTTVTVLGSIQELLKNPKLSILIVTYTKKSGKDFLTAIKNPLENNEHIKYLFNDILYKDPVNQAPTSTWSTEGISIIPNSTNRFHSITYCSLESQKTGHHANLMIYDDVVVPESVKVKEKRDELKSLFDISKNLGSTTSGINRRQIVGTRYHKDDLYGDLILKNAVKVRIKYPTDNGQKDGKLLLVSKSIWEDTYLPMNDYDFYCQMFQNPYVSTKTVFRLENIKFYSKVPDKNMHIFIIVDPATSKKRGSDYTSICVLGYQPKGRLSSQKPSLYLLDGIRDKLDGQETYQRLKYLYKKWSFYMKVKNIKGSVEVFYEVFGGSKDIELLDQYKSKDGLFFEINMIRPKGNKSDRIKSLAYYINVSNLYLPAATCKSMQNGKYDIKLNKIRVEGERYIFDTIDYSHEKFKNHFINIDKHVEKNFKYIDKDVFIDHSLPDNQIAAYPICRKDSEGKLYDYTDSFLEELMEFPLNDHDDVIDSVAMVNSIDDLSGYSFFSEMY